MGLEVLAMSPSQLAAFLVAETAKYADLLRKSGIKPD
jgi:hypothetical protein